MESRSICIKGLRKGEVNELPLRDVSYQHAISAMAGLLETIYHSEGGVNLEFRPGSYGNGKMSAWACFNTLTNARSVAEDPHGQKPIFTGHT